MAIWSVARTWGTTAGERARAFPCDEYLPDPDDAYFRAVDVEASPAALFRWLCQLRVAPYSYDCIDNFGRRSPRRLTPGVEDLRVGQRIMTIFELVAFEPDRHLTIRMRNGRGFFGDVAVSYLVLPRGAEGPGAEGSRLLVKVLVRHPRRQLLRELNRTLLPWGDLLMMRRQLLTLGGLAASG